jgi:large subunit ribosomal protein L25
MELANLKPSPVRCSVAPNPAACAARAAFRPWFTGLDQAPHSCTVDAKAFDAEFDKGNRTFKLAIAGKEEAALLKDVQFDTYGKDVLHIDFHRVDLTVKVRVAVALAFVGAPEANAAAIVDHASEDIHVECLPTDIPSSLEVKLDGMQVGQRIEAKDVKLPAGVTFSDDAHKVLVTYHWRHAEPAAAEAAPAAEAGLRSPKPRRSPKRRVSMTPSGRSPARLALGIRQPGGAVRRDAPQRRIRRPRSGRDSSRSVVLVDRGGRRNGGRRNGRPSISSPQTGDLREPERGGAAAPPRRRRGNPGRVLVVCDDMALEPGALRLRASGSPGGHNGLRSVIAELGTEAIPA